MRKLTFTLLAVLCSITLSFSQSWTTQVSNVTTTLRNVNFPDSCTGYIFGSTGRVLKTTTRGGEWFSKNTSSNFTIYSSHFFSTTIGIAVGQNISAVPGEGVTLITFDGANSWVIDSSSFPERLFDVHFANTSFGWISGRNGYIAKSINSGITWTPQTSPINEHLNSVHSTGINNCWIAGDVGTILVTANGGTNWTTQTSGTTQNLFGIFFINSLKGWAVGSGGTIRATIDGGTTWTTQTSGTTLTLYDVTFVTDSIGWAVGSTGTIITTTNGGTTWTTQTSGSTLTLRSIDMLSSTLGWVAGSTGTILHYSNQVPPLADFSTTFSICLGNSNAFTDLSLGSPASWLWNFGDGSTSTLQNPSHTYTSAGAYNVVLTIVTPTGCTDTITKVVTVNPGIPVANFSGIPTTICTGGTVAFTDLSTSSPSSWNWDFGDGKTSTLQNPTNVYVSAGSYNVTLIATNGCGSNTKTVNTYITVLSAPVADFTNTTACFGNATVFTDASTGSISSWSWNFGDGTPASTAQNPSHTYAAASVYFVTLTVTSPGGCTNAISKLVTVNATPTANFTNTTVCLGNLTNFTDLSTGVPTTWSWNFGDGNVSTLQNPSNTYAAAGTYNATLTVSNALSCNNTISKSVTVNILPTANFTADTVCLGKNTTFTNTSLNSVSWSWNFGDGVGTSTLQNPTYTYATSGSFSVVLIAYTASGCLNTIVKSTIVNTLPTANAGTDQSILCNQTTNLLATATGGSGTYSYKWNNGAATDSNNAVTAGTYTVTVTDGNGCKATDAVSVILTGTTLALSASNDTTICFGSAATILAAATGGILPYTYLWSTGATASSIFAGNGSYSVQVTDSSGCKLSKIINVTQNPLLIAYAGTDISVCSGASATFTASASGGNGIYFYLWSTGATTSSITAGNGTYVITLTDGLGCKTTDTINIIEYTPITASLGIDKTICAGVTTTILTTVSGGSGIYSYLWNTGATTASVSVNAGTYIVIVTDDAGCSGRDTVVISTSSIAVNAGVDQSILCSQTANLLAVATGGSSPYSFKWSNGVATDINLNVIAGTYIVTVTDSKSCINTDAVSVILTGTTLSLSASNDTSVCFGTFATISASASGGVQPYTYLWNTGAANTFISVKNGSYSVQVTDSTGCKLSDIINVTENPALIANTGADVSICNGTTTTASASASGGNGIYFYSWSTGATTSSITAGNGTYVITLNDGLGCTTTDTIKITENTLLTVSLGNDKTICAGTTTSITATVSGGSGIYFYLWNTGETTASVTVSSGGYSVIVTDDIGCVSSDAIIINNSVTVNAGIDQTIVCGATANLLATASGGITPYTYSWNNGTTSANNNGVNAGNHIVIVTDNMGCKHSDTVTVNLAGSTLSLTMSSDVTICNGATTTLSATVSGGTTPYSYLWNTTQTSSSITVGGGNYNLIVTDFVGCELSGFVKVTENSALTVNAGSDTMICSGASLVISAIVSGGTGNYSYLWSNASTATSISVNTTGSYSIGIVDGIGCTANDTISVTFASVTAAFTQSADTINLALTGTVSFTNQSTGANTWSWNFGNGSTSIAQNPAAAYTSIGTYTVTLIASFGNCTATATSQIVVINVIGLDENNFSDRIEVFPNPTANGKITIAILSNGYKYAKLHIEDINGKVLYKEKNNMPLNDKLELDLSNLPKGTYMLKLDSGDKILNKMLILQ